MPPIVTSSEYFTIDGTPSATPGWDCLDLSPLWDGPNVKGSDRDLPAGAGVSYPRRPTISVRDLPFVFSGDALYDGTTAGTARQRLLANLNYFRTNVADPKTTGDGTRTLILHLPDGTTRTGPVTVESPLRLGPIGPGGASAVLRLVLPLGALV